MNKLLLVCLVVTMLFSASAFATGFVPMGSIGQTQGFSLYGENAASQVGSSASSSAGNMLTVGQSNNLTEFCSPMLTQNQGSMLMQGASTSGHCGTLGVQQIGGSTGNQGQLLASIGCKDMTTQTQSLGSTIQMAIDKDGGHGAAEGTQSSIADQSQTILSGKTIMNSTQSIGSIQNGSVSGNNWSGGSVFNYADISATQTQTAN